MMEELNRRVGRLRDKACCAAGEGTGAGKLRSLSGDGWEEAFMEIKEPRDVQLKTVSFTSAMEKTFCQRGRRLEVSGSTSGCESAARLSRC